jgi:hypothetical protein
LSVKSGEPSGSPALVLENSSNEKVGGEGKGLGVGIIKGSALWDEDRSVIVFKTAWSWALRMMRLGRGIKGLVRRSQTENSKGSRGEVERGSKN